MLYDVKQSRIPIVEEMIYAGIKSKSYHDITIPTGAHYYYNLEQNQLVAYQG